MKSIITSVSPYLCGKIASGDCKILVKKSAPKGTPFKVYIYCTKGKDSLREVDCWNTKTEIHKTNHRIINLDYCTNKISNGKVIGEFICDKVDNFYCVSVTYQRENNLGYGQFIDNGVYKVNNWHEGIAFERDDRYIDTMLNNNDLKKMCLTAQELFNYIGVGKHLYGWHISDLKIYDKPRELSEFYIPCKKPICRMCDWEREYDVCACGYKKHITRPPQSWQYVEKIETR